MSRLDCITTLAIKHNPDIQVSVTFDADTGRYVGAIIKGREQNYNVLFTSAAIYDTYQEAAADMRTIIASARVSNPVPETSTC